MENMEIVYRDSGFMKNYGVTERTEGIFKKHKDVIIA
jgi:hypothetical protein